MGQHEQAVYEEMRQQAESLGREKAKWLLMKAELEARIAELETKGDE